MLIRLAGPIVALAISLVASTSMAAPSAEPSAKGDAKKGEKAEAVQLDSIPRAGNPGVDTLLDAAREKLVKRTKRENERRDALKEEAERQRKIRQSLKDAGVNLEYLPEPEAMRQAREMTSPEVQEEPDLRPEELYSKIEAAGGGAGQGLQAELSDDQRQIVLRVLCKEKGSSPDGQTLSDLKITAEKARELQSELCD